MTKVKFIELVEMVVVVEVAVVVDIAVVRLLEWDLAGFLCIFLTIQNKDNF